MRRTPATGLGKIDASLPFPDRHSLKVRGVGPFVIEVDFLTSRVKSLYVPVISMRPREAAFQVSVKGAITIR